MSRFAQPGRVNWIGIRRQRREPPTIVQDVMATVECGLEGDHYSGRSRTRQVTLIDACHLPAIASYLGLRSVGPEQLRRNIVVAGINLLALKDRSFQIGAAILRFRGLCHPCTRMEENLGSGGYNAVRGHGGICAEVTESGRILSLIHI